MTTLDGLYIDAVTIAGSTKSFSVSLNQLNETGDDFEPIDLSNYAIRFSILGAPTADSAVLVEHVITTNTDMEVDGEITDPTNGEFSFTVTAEDTKTTGLGKFPIKLEILDGTSLSLVSIITEGGNEGEFNAIQIVEC